MFITIWKHDCSPTETTVQAFSGEWEVDFIECIMEMPEIEKAELFKDVPTERWMTVEIHQSNDGPDIYFTVTGYTADKLR